jgi:hypothetical protein
MGEDERAGPRWVIIDGSDVTEYQTEDELVRHVEKHPFEHNVIEAIAYVKYRRWLADRDAGQSS